MRRHEMPMERGSVMKFLSMLGAILLLAGTVACFKTKEKPLVPLALESGVKPQVVTLTEQGTQAYQANQFDDAKNYFSQAVAAAPQSGPAHYNYALALNALGDSEQARQQFMEAANLAPGDKVIWDSPALRPYGNVESPKKKLIPPGAGRQGLGGGTGGPGGPGGPR
jgi:tetratricopeptide (TPR) repeat protein